MNHRGGWALIRHTWLSWMQHRSFFFLLAFGWMIPPLIYLFVWSTAAASKTVAGLTRGEFVAYYLILVLVNQLTYAQTNWTVGDLIREGNMSRLLLYPMSPLYNTVATEIAGKVVTMSFVIPVTLLLALLLRPELHILPDQAAAFIPALTLAWLLRFFWGYWLALLAFWATRADSLLALQDALIFLLGGLVAPVGLLPQGIRLAATTLPFRYMVSFPVEVLTGQVTGPALATGFVIQAGWLLVAVALYLLMWQRGVRHYTAIGG
jgi:ABC-2 type transport system permease protein